MGRPQSQYLPVHILSTKVTANHTYTGDDMRRVITRFDKDNIREPALAGPDHGLREQQGRHARPDLVGLDAAQERFHRAHPRLGQAGTHPGNLGAADVDLTDEEFVQIEAELAKIKIHGTAPTRTSPSSAKPPDPPPSDRSFAGVLPPLSEIGRAVREPPSANRGTVSVRSGPAWGPCQMRQATAAYRYGPTLEAARRHCSITSGRGRTLSTRSYHQ
jgi:hypothetical protein